MFIYMLGNIFLLEYPKAVHLDFNRTVCRSVRTVNRLRLKIYIDIVFGPVVCNTSLQFRLREIYFFNNPAEIFPG